MSDDGNEPIDGDDSCDAAFRSALGDLAEQIDLHAAGELDDRGVAHLGHLAERVADLARTAPGDVPRVRRDALTGLSDRRSAIERLDSWGSSGEDATVVFVDLDRFKSVNDAYGHAVGDEILRQVAARLLAATRAEDVVARVAGDEFLVLARRAESDVSVDLASRIADAASFTAQVGQLRVPVTASAGCASQELGESAEDVVTNADVAMHRAKERGGAQLVRFDTEMRTRLLERLSLEREIRFGLEHEEFAVWFQPVIGLASGALVGAEALVRWNHPHRGRLEPAAFISAAEDAGLIARLDRVVLRSTLGHLADWQSREWLGAEFRVGINMSAERFAEPDLVESVISHLAAVGVAAERVVIEITETAMMRDVEESRVTMGKLTDAGLRLSVDDFGTGWSSLAYLKQFPVDSLKIDQSFVAGLDGNADDAAIVRATVQLASALGLGVVAEGVERAEQADALMELGCDSVQGYFYGRPVPAPEFADRWLGGVANA